MRTFMYNTMFFCVLFLVIFFFLLFLLLLLFRLNESKNCVCVCSVQCTPLRICWLEHVAAIQWASIIITIRLNESWVIKQSKFTIILRCTPVAPFSPLLDARPKSHAPHTYHFAILFARIFVWCKYTYVNVCMCVCTFFPSFHFFGITFFWSLGIWFVVRIRGSGKNTCGRE